MAGLSQKITDIIEKVLFILIYYSSTLHFTGSTYTSDDGGWITEPTSMIAKPGPCNIEIRGPDLSKQEFLYRYAFSSPVVIRNASDNKAFREFSTRENILKNYGNREVILSTANSYSYEKVHERLTDYVNTMQPQSLKKYGNETLYWFGDNDLEGWKDLFDMYIPPPFNIPGKTGSYSFGVAGPGTGVPFHWHGPGFAEVIYGTKRWFFYPPEIIPMFNPNKTSLHWLLEDYDDMPAHRKPLECTVGPGEVIYFPDRWWHSTLNINTSVFISTFLS